MLCGISGAWAYSGIKLTFSRVDAGSGTATNAVSDVTVNVTDMDGNALSGITATLASTSITELKIGSAAALGRTTNSVLAPNAGYENVEGGTITYTFCVTGLSTDFAYKYAALDVYALTGGGTSQYNTGSTVRYWTFDISTGTTADAVASFISQSGNDICTVNDESDGLYHKNWEMTAASEKAATATLYIKVVLTKTASLGCYAGLAGVTLSGDQDIWESRNGWAQATGGVGHFYWYAVKTPGDASTTYTLNSIQLMEQTGAGNNDNYLAIAYSPSILTLDASQVIGISSNHNIASSTSLLTYNFSDDVNLLGGSVYYFVFLSSNTPTDGAYPVTEACLSLNHSDYGAYPYGNNAGSTGANFWPYFKAVTDLSATTGYCVGDKLGGTMESGNWKNVWTSGTSPSFTLTASANNINNTSGSYTGGLDIRSGSSKSSTYTITAPSGYIITGYKLFGRALTTNQTVTPSEGGSAVTFTTYGNSLCVSGIEALETTFTLTDSDNSGLFLEAIQVNLEAATYFVVYKVQDSSENILFTSDPIATLNGTNITTLPAEYQLTNFYTYDNIDLTISSTGNTDAVFTATPKAEPLIRYTADASAPEYYNLNIRSKYLVYDDDATGDVTLQDESEPFNSYASWAFIGEPYAGFKIINKQKGTGYFLTYTSVVTNRHSDNNIQFVASGDFTNQYWLIDTNSSGIVLRMKENTDIYFHHDNTYNYLRTCSKGEYGTVHNDAGSTIVASTDEDVLLSLNDYMQSITIGSGAGECYSTDPSTLTDEDAIGTISSVNAAILGSATAQYPAAYAALVQVKSLLAVNAPAAGFYRLKNVATGKYLVATATSTYGSTNKYVFANGTATDAATVIRLFDTESNGTLYMYNQGHGFGWTVSDKSYGGVAWITSTPNKYVHWFPGTGTNQIAFAICYGNGVNDGVNDYSSYLKKGIHTANGSEEVVAGTDDTIDEAQWVIEAATSATVALHDGGDGYNYATFCAPFSYTVSGATAYTLAASGNWLVPTALEGEVAAGTPVLLKGSSETATLTIGTGYAATSVTGTALTGTYLSTTIDGETDYVLGTDGTTVGFYHWDQNTLGANRAYIDTPSNVKGFAINWDLTDGIDAASIENGQQAKNATIYNIAGQRVSKAQKGIYIQNGKKVVIK